MARDVETSAVWTRNVTDTSEGRIELVESVVPWGRYANHGVKYN